MLTVYLDNSLITALERRDQSNGEMAALDLILSSAQSGALRLVTSRESIREIERTPDEATKSALKTCLSAAWAVSAQPLWPSAILAPSKSGAIAAYQLTRSTQGHWGGTPSSRGGPVIGLLLQCPRAYASQTSDPSHAMPRDP